MTITEHRHGWEQPDIHQPDLLCDLVAAPHSDQELCVRVLAVWDEVDRALLV
jgi:hypothetical protein